MSSTPESGDIHDVSHVVSFPGASIPREPLTLEQLEAAALHDEPLQNALATVVECARKLFGTVRKVTFNEDPEIEGRTYYIIEVPVRGSVDEAMDLENQWLDDLDVVGEFIPRFALHLNFHQ